MSVRLEIAIDNDVEVLRDLYNAAHITKVEYGDVSWGTADQSFENQEILGMIGSGMQKIVIGEKVVGAVTLGDKDEKIWGAPDNELYIGKFVVSPEYKGQGIGEEAMEMVAELAAQEGRRALRLDCEAHNAKLCRLYEDLGFLRVGELTVDNSIHPDGVFHSQRFEKLI